MKRQKQSGFTHLIIFLILVLALVGALGFIFYQNFIQKKDAVVKVIDSPNQTKKDVDNVDANKGYLVLSDWGVKFKVPELATGNQITYYKTYDSYLGDLYDFSTTRVEALGEACIPTNEPYVSLGRLYRLSSPNTSEASPPLLLEKIGDYYYYYRHPQSMCANEGEDLQNSDMVVIQSLLQSIIDE